MVEILPQLLLFCSESHLLFIIKFLFTNLNFLLFSLLTFLSWRFERMKHFHVQIWKSIATYEIFTWTSELIKVMPDS